MVARRDPGRVPSVDNLLKKGGIFNVRRKFKYQRLENMTDKLRDVFREVTIS